VNIQQYSWTCPTCPDKFIQDYVVATCTVWTNFDCNCRSAVVGSRFHARGRQQKSPSRRISDVSRCVHRLGGQSDSLRRRAAQRVRADAEQVFAEAQEMVAAVRRDVAQFMRGNAGARAPFSVRYWYTPVSFFLLPKENTVPLAILRGLILASSFSPLEISATEGEKIMMIIGYIYCSILCYCHIVRDKFARSWV